jgi:hypothetical protein
MNSNLRSIAEHEAAHAVVARAFGYDVIQVHVDTANGVTAWDSSTAPPAHQAAVTAAGDVWGRDHSQFPYVDLGCADLAGFEARFGLDQLWTANRTAGAILAEHRVAVLALASRLITERTITFD